MVNTRNSAEKGDSVAIICERIEDHLESLVVSLKNVIAAVESRQHQERRSVGIDDEIDDEINNGIEAIGVGTHKIKGLYAIDGGFDDGTGRIDGGLDGIRGADVKDDGIGAGTNGIEDGIQGQSTDMISEFKATDEIIELQLEGDVATIKSEMDDKELEGAPQGPVTNLVKEHNLGDDSISGVGFLSCSTITNLAVQHDTSYNNRTLHWFWIFIDFGSKLSEWVFLDGWVREK